LRPWPTSAAGDSFAERTDHCHHYSLLPEQKNLLAVLWIPANSFSPMSLTLLNNLSLVSTTALITFFLGVVDTGQKKPKSLKFIVGVNDTADKFIGSVSDTGD
jgi:hypothetical protein